MYFKHRDVGSLGNIVLSEVKNLSVWPTEMVEANHTKTRMFALCNDDSDDADELAFYDTEAEAGAVFENICKALSEGKIFYDLTGGALNG